MILRGVVLFLAVMLTVVASREVIGGANPKERAWGLLCAAFAAWFLHVALVMEIQ